MTATASHVADTRASCTDSFSEAAVGLMAFPSQRMFKKKKKLKRCFKEVLLVKKYHSGQSMQGPLKGPLVWRTGFVKPSGFASVS